jgi:Kef-type K+ transport system membrane component KefB
MGLDNIVLELAVIFSGAALLGTLFLYLRQPIILAYILLGMLIGPMGFRVLDSAEHIEHLSHIGIILLLFLLGLNLHPTKLLHLFRKTAVVTLGTSMAFMLLGMGICLAFSFGFKDALVVGAAMMFSSTIVSIKLIPTTTLHQRHAGEMMISVLLFQDILAILLILFLGGGQGGGGLLVSVLVVLKLAALGAGSFFAVKYVILPLFKRFDVIKEYFFLGSLGWCLWVAEGSKLLGLSDEMGAFTAGVALAAFPVALVIAENLKPLREFFLILFFFSIGARFDLFATEALLAPALVLTAVIMLAKPLFFRRAFSMINEEPRISRELGFRLGQASEFSLLLAYSAEKSGNISSNASYLIQTVVIFTFIISTYLVVSRYPTPISHKNGLRSD